MAVLIMCERLDPDMGQSEVSSGEKSPPTNPTPSLPEGVSKGRAVMASLLRVSRSYRPCKGELVLPLKLKQNTV